MATELRAPYRKYTKEFRRMALERMAQCDNIAALAHETFIHGAATN